MASNLNTYRHLSGLSLAQRFAKYSSIGLLSTPEFVRDFGIRQNSILARVFTIDYLTHWQVGGALSQFWGPNIGFQIREVDLNLFILTFNSSEDFTWIENNGPWYPLGNVISATKAYPGMKISTDSVKEIHIWASILNAKQEHRSSREMIELIGSRIGRVSRVSVGSEVSAPDRLPGVMVWVNIEKPLVDKLLVKVGGYPVTEILFNYHNLPPMFCNHCFRFGHKETSCAITQGRPLEHIYDISVDSPYPEDDLFVLNNVQVQIWNPKDIADSLGLSVPVEDYLNLSGVSDTLQNLVGSSSLIGNRQSVEELPSHPFGFVNSEIHRVIDLARSNESEQRSGLLEDIINPILNRSSAIYHFATNCEVNYDFNFSIPYFSSSSSEKICTMSTGNGKSFKIDQYGSNMNLISSTMLQEERKVKSKEEEQDHHQVLTLKKQRR